MDPSGECFTLVDVSYYEKYAANAVWRQMKDGAGFPEHDPGFDPMGSGEFAGRFAAYFRNYLDESVCRHRPMRSQSSYVFCVDCRRSDVWRRCVFPGYKHSRDVTVPKFSMDGIKEWPASWMRGHNSMYGSATVSCPGAEADDVIAVLSRKFRREFPDVDVLIVSGDSDLLQLGGPGIVQIDSRGDVVTIAQRLDSDGVSFDPTPMNYLKYKIMTGDSTDDIPSIKYRRCGPKKAASMVRNEDELRQFLNSDEQVRRDFIRNSSLIDLRRIPHVIVESIEAQA